MKNRRRIPWLFSDWGPRFIWILLVCILLHSNFSIGQTGLYDQIQNLQAPRIFARKDSFTLPKSAGTVRQITYGNPDVGYFISTNIKQTGRKLTLTWIPPSYRNPIGFQASVSTPDGRTNVLQLGKRKFTNPLGTSFDSRISVIEPPDFPFVMVDWTFGNGPTFGSSVVVPLAVNRLGEVVWMYHDPAFPASHQRWGEASAILDQGRFLFLKRAEETRATVINSWGKVEKDIDFQANHIPYGNSHTVQFLKDTDEILFLSFDCRTLPWYQEFIPLFQGPLGWLRLLKLPRRTYLGSKVIRLSLDTLKTKEVWDTFDSFSPKRDPSLAVTPFTAPDLFMDAQSSRQYRSLLHRPGLTWAAWPERFCQVDWSHENSVDYRKGEGYLVSIRNFNKLILLDKNGKIKWTMGEGRKNTYAFHRDGSGFSMQHSAIFLKNGHILMFDNHSPYRGFSGYPYWNRVMELNPTRPGWIRPEWSFTLPVPPSDVRGSVAELSNGDYFAYSAGNPGLPSHLFEIDPKTSLITGHIQLNIYSIQRGVAAQPFYGFGGDRYLGVKEPSHSKSEKGTQDILEFSY